MFVYIKTIYESRNLLITSFKFIFNTMKTNKNMMKLGKTLTLLIVGSFFIHSTFGFSYDGNCKAHLDDGRIIDLSPLDNTTNPL